MTGSTSRGGNSRTQVAKQWAFRLFVACGIHHLFRRWHRDKLLIVVYHGVRPDDTPDDTWHLVGRTALERQCAYLRDHYDVLPLDEALQQLGRGPRDRPLAAVTFDDGYRNNRSEALPVLARAGVPATVFLATGLIGTRLTVWTHQVAAMFRDAGARVGSVRLGTRELRSGGNGDWRRPARQAIDLLKALPATERSRAMEALRAQLQAASPEPDPRLAMMTWDDVTGAERSGMIRFGAHTVSHTIVSRLDDAELEREIAESVDAVRAHVGQPSAVFAYPNGRQEDFDGRAAGVLRQRGVRWAVSTVEGLNAADQDPFAMKRIVVANDTSLADFQLRTAGVLTWAKGLAARR